MSDLYDSLEDESENESCHSLDKLKTNFLNPDEGTVKPGSISGGGGREPFFLDRGEQTGEREIEVPLVQATTITDLTSKNCCQVKSFFPKVADEVKKYGSNSASFNAAIDNEDLVKKGLQLNKDGSFTKSPRFEAEQLPFVNPEYKNLQLQKLKTQPRGKSRFSKKNRKNVFTFKEDSKDEISMIGIIKSRETKGSSEEILTSDGSLLSFKEIASKSGENLDKDNLTDSMKEMIMQKQNESITVRANKSLEQYRKPVRGITLPGNGKCSKSKTHSNRNNSKETLPNVSGDKRNASVTTNFEKGKSQSNTWKKKLPQVGEVPAKNFNPVVRKPSEILLNFSKPRLSYFERRQRESGFNPLYLRYGVKRVPSDTNRSNFGDSVADKLSEMSGRVVSSRGFTDDEDEELFYRKLIEKDKSKQWEVNRTSRSDIHKEKGLCSSSSCKNQKELTRSDKFYSRQKLKKSTSIDMPTATANSSLNPSKKYSHYCSVNVSSSSMSKTELALKARAYGYMANARNIFKMKTQSEGKVVQSESEIRGKRISKKVGNNETSARGKESSEEMEQGFGVTSKRLLRTSKSLCKAVKYDSVADKGIVFPPVCCSETKDLQHKSEVLKRIRCCLSGETRQSPGNVDLNSVMKHLRGKCADSLPPFKCAR